VTAAGGGAGYGWEGGHEQDWMGYPSPQSSRKKIIIAMLAVVALVAVGGGVLGFAMHRRHAPPGNSAATGSASPTAPRSGTASPPAGPAGGNATVAVAPGVARNPHAAPIVTLLTTYFTAINSHDFSSYQALLNPQMKRSVTLSRFAAGYRSTTDSGATLAGISAAPDGRTIATVTFTSHQDPADSPDRSACTNWSIRLYLQRAGGGYLIGPAVPGYRASHQPC
jgi:hypothetical protein